MERATKRIAKDEFVHKASFGFGYWDTVEVLIDIDHPRPKPVCGVVVSTPSYEYEKREDAVNDVLVIVGSTLFCFGPSDIKKVIDRPINVVSAEIEEDLDDGE